MPTFLLRSIYFLFVLSFISAANAQVGDSELVIIHVGDIHGHFDSHTNSRSDNNGLPEGGIARVYTKVQELRAAHQHTLTLMTGDTVHGSAEALFTEGQALIDILNEFSIDAYAPGNWEFVSANVYYNGVHYADKTGENVLPSYIVRVVNGKKIGLLGFTTERGPKVIGSEVVQGFRFTKGDSELAALIPVLRDVENVDVIIMLSELGMANNIRLTEKYPGVDLVLSSDMHEETPQKVTNSVGTVLVAQGQDGANVGEIKIDFGLTGIIGIDFTQHAIDTDTTEDLRIAGMVADISKTFRTGPDFIEHVNPINGHVLTTPLDTVVGTAIVDLHRSNYTHETMPAVLEGSSHNFLAEAYHEMMGADIGVIRGFRYGTTVRAGEITLGDIYHYMPIGPGIAKGELSGAKINKIIQKSANGSLNPDVSAWGGGWLFGWSGVRFDIDVYQSNGHRVTNISIYDRTTNTWAALDPAKIYTMG